MSLCLNGMKAECADDVRSIVLTDRCGKIVYCNASWSLMCGFTLEEVIGKTNAVLQGPLTERYKTEFIKNSLRRGEPFSTTITNYKKNGWPFKNLLTVSPLEDGFCAEV